MPIGIWGYGKVGQALTKYFLEKSTDSILLMDQNRIDASLLSKAKGRVLFYSEKEKNNFFNESSILFVSPGIDIKENYQTIKDKLSSEIDLFFDLWKKPIIAITGSNGKTSTTHFLHSLLRQFGLKTAIGGNIGTPTIELIAQQAESSYAVIEVSSFQLEHARRFAPELAIITNISPNHLDRHITIKAYFQAKYTIIRNQGSHQKALIPLALYAWVMQEKPSSRVSVFCTNPTEQEYADLKTISNDAYCFILRSNQFLVLYCGVPIDRIDILNQKKTFDENILVLMSACFLLGHDIKLAISYFNNVQPLEHRFEFVATVQGIDFYNDSKSTTIQSTIAAINKCKEKNIFLLVGGLSKGVDRTPLFQTIKNNVDFVACFGKEATKLAAMCNQNGIAHSQHEELTSAFEAAVQKASRAASGIVLFSPAGSSYDLFRGYQERGLAFKKLVFCLLSDQNV